MSATNAVVLIRKIILVHEGFERVIEVAQSDSEELLCHHVSAMFNLPLGHAFVLQDMNTHAFINSFKGNYLCNGNNTGGKYRVAVQGEGASVIESCRILWRNFVLLFFNKLTFVMLSRRDHEGYLHIVLCRRERLHFNVTFFLVRLLREVFTIKTVSRF